MAEVITEWAGKERLFRLSFGGVLDLEEATGDGIAAIFARVAGGRFMLKDVYHTIRLSLIGGGLSIMDAKRLLEAHFDTRPYMENAAIAGQVLAALMVGVEPAGEEPETDAQGRYVFSEVSQICRVFNLSPVELRDMRYADFVNMVRGFNSGSETKAPHITEEEFIDILNRYEPEVVQ
jgi:hypothetical protein